jgi:hypothetical protein
LAPALCRIASRRPPWRTSHGSSAARQLGKAGLQGSGDAVEAFGEPEPAVLVKDDGRRDRSAICNIVS